MNTIVRQCVWHNPYAIETLPCIARFYRAAYSPSARLRYDLLKYPLRLSFALAYRLGLRGRGTLRLNVAGLDRILSFDGRNLQFSSLYMPQHMQGYEAETTALLDMLVRPKDVFYDIGSNWGYYALFIAARQGFMGKVHAFEPHPNSFLDLKSLVTDARALQTVTCHNLALSDRNALGCISSPDGIHSGLVIVKEGGNREIVLRRLDDMEIEPPDVIKLDVEDHEAQVILGGSKVLSRGKPHIVFESCLSRQTASQLAPFEVLSQFGYSFFHPTWLGGEGANLHCVEHLNLTEGHTHTLALVQFEPQQRSLFRALLNVFACHRDRLSELDQWHHLSSLDGAVDSSELSTALGRSSAEVEHERNRRHLRVRQRSWDAR